MAADLMAGRGGGGTARPSLWQTPTPYVLLAVLFLMGMIAVPLLFLICCHRRRRAAARVDEAAPSMSPLVPLDREAPKLAVVMPGDKAPSFLASAEPFVPSVPLPTAATTDKDADASM